MLMMILLVMVSSCATHGPFVRNLTKDGSNLKFEECDLYINGFWGNTETRNCVPKKIKIN
jgi:hypothetical protein